MPYPKEPEPIWQAVFVIGVILIFVTLAYAAVWGN